MKKCVLAYQKWILFNWMKASEKGKAMESWFCFDYFHDTTFCMIVCPSIFFSIHLPTILLVCISICMCATHYNDVIISTMASPITSLTDVYSTIHSGTDERKHQSSASLALVRVIHWWPVNSLAKKASNMENVSIWWRHHAYHFSDDL